jgi:hypothetical protein
MTPRHATVAVIAAVNALVRYLDRTSPAYQR